MPSSDAAMISDAAGDPDSGLVGDLGPPMDATPVEDPDAAGDSAMPEPVMDGSVEVDMMAANPTAFLAAHAIEWAGDHQTCCSEANGDDVAGGYPLQPGDRLGRSTAALGDLDRDGIPDVIAGASRDGDGANRAGAIFVLTLNRDRTVKFSRKLSQLYGDFSTATAADGTAYPALDEQDRFGYSVATLGDLDGDGIAEILGGADGDDDGYDDDPSQRSNAGAVYVLFLRADGTVRQRQKISNLHGGLGAALDVAMPLGASDGFGQSAGAVGDLDGDHIPDVMVGAPGASGGGAVYLLLLNADGTVKNAHVYSQRAGGFAAAAGEGAIANGDSFGGRGVNALGDLDGDGRTEIVVGAHGTDVHGAVWILWIDENFQVSRKQKISSNGSGGFGFVIDEANGQTNTDEAQFGHSLAALGDIDGDGIPDLAVSANNQGSGTLYMLTLNQDGTVRTTSRFGSDDAPEAFAGLEGLAEEDRLCRSMASPGDVSGDGGFSIICGGGAHETGDLWLLSFAPNTCQTEKPATCVSYPAGQYDRGSQPAGMTFTLQPGPTYCRGGETLQSNWDHNTQVVTGPLTLDACKRACGELQCTHLTVKATDGRCIVKTGCELADSEEGSMTFVVD